MKFCFLTLTFFFSLNILSCYKNFLRNRLQMKNNRPMDVRQVMMMKSKKKESFFPAFPYFMKEDFNRNGYKYHSYNDINRSFEEMAKNYPNLVEVYTAQKKFNLPHPTGNCGSKECSNLIVELGNKSKFNKETSQIYISGTLHGDERVGPTLTVEFAKLILENYKSNKWMKYLLDNRRIIITPVTNAYAYYTGRREETTDSENSFLYDPNRDFPILKPTESCMNTITARVINEIFVRNLIKVSISLHAGTSSLTYAYGTPNHIINLYSTYRIPFNLAKSGNSEITDIINQYYIGNVDNLPINTSTEPPDNSALEELSSAIVNFSNEMKNFQYPTGKMNDLVYPVRGGFEDWAYSASWEGYPVITEGCNPHTYGGYDRERTMYSKNFPDAIRAISYLLETSDEKTPKESNLGKIRTECALEVFNNPFNFKKQIDENLKNDCLSQSYNGYISKNLRLLLVTIDLLEPYVNYEIELETENGKNYLKIRWVIGGSKTVDETFLIFSYKREGDSFLDLEFEGNVESAKKDNFLFFSYLKSKKYKKTQLKSGYAIWSEQRKFTVFEERLEVPANTKVFTATILFKVDQNMKLQKNPDPEVSARTHFVNERTNPTYKAENNGYVVKGKSYFSSEIIRFNLKDKN